MNRATLPRCPGCDYPTAGAFCVGCWGHPSWPLWLKRKITRGNDANRAAAIAQGAELIRSNGGPRNGATK